jgi:acyl-CoA thioesterase FadM
MTVLVCGVRTRTFDLCIRATGIEGDFRFTGKITPIIVNRDTFTSVEIPGGAKELLRRYEHEFVSIPQTPFDDPSVGGAGIAGI